MGLRDMLNTDPVSALPLRPALAVAGRMPVREVMALMQARGLGCVFVVDAEHRPVGMFSERVLLPLLREAGALDRPVSKAAIALRCCVKRSDPVIAVIREMARRDIRFVCVVDEAGRLAGLTGQRGLMEYLAERFPRQVRVQELASKLHRDEREGA